MENSKRSKHARERQQQRSFSDVAVAVVESYGRLVRQRGQRWALFVGRKEVKQARAKGLRLDAYENHAVVFAADGTIVTVIKSPDLSRLARRKEATWRRRQRQRAGR